MKWSAVALLNVLLLCSCGSYPRAENSLDAAREFIDGCLKGNFEKAAFYMVQDKENTAQLEKLKREYREKSNSQKSQYAGASINILEDEAVSDTVHIINYKNSFDNIARKAKVIQRGKEWLVDLKYTFDGNL